MKVLVAYASRHGSTAEIAERIGARLREAGHEVEVERVDEIADVDGCDAVVLGSAVYVGKWLEPARSFVDAHAATLCSRRVWLFSSGPLGEPPRPEADHCVDVANIVEATRAIEHQVFAGRLDRSTLGVGERAVARLVKVAEGDFREFDAIDEWADEIARVCTLSGQAIQTS